MNITNETTTERRMSDYAQRRQDRRAPMFDQPQRPYVREDVLAEQTLEIERKKFLIRHCSNVRGEFVRITEESIEGGRFNTVIVPGTGMHDFLRALAKVTGPGPAVKNEEASK